MVDTIVVPLVTIIEEEMMIVMKDVCIELVLHTKRKTKKTHSAGSNYQPIFYW
jgi:hypothetical protein